jgi:hypothetical protein
MSKLGWLLWLPGRLGLISQFQNRPGKEANGPWPACCGAINNFSVSAELWLPRNPQPPAEGLWLGAGSSWFRLQDLVLCLTPPHLCSTPTQLQGLSKVQGSPCPPVALLGYKPNHLSWHSRPLESRALPPCPTSASAHCRHAGCS